jgi:hypothetical protein
MYDLGWREPLAPRASPGAGPVDETGAIGGENGVRQQSPSRAHIPARLEPAPPAPPPSAETGCEAVERESAWTLCPLSAFSGQSGNLRIMLPGRRSYLALRHIDREPGLASRGGAPQPEEVQCKRRWRTVAPGGRRIFGGSTRLPASCDDLGTVCPSDECQLVYQLDCGRLACRVRTVRGSGRRPWRARGALRPE